MMRDRLLVAPAVALAVMMLAGGAAIDAGQGSARRAAPAAKTWKAPRTPHGHPDLQGNWDAATLTPLERPKGVNLTLSDEEARKLVTRELDVVARRAQPSDPNRTAPPVGGDGSTGAAGGVGGYNNFWIDRGSRIIKIDGAWRSGLIIDPPDGRIPPMLPEAQKRNSSRGLTGLTQSDAPQNVQSPPGQYDDIEQRPLGERCIIGFGSTSGPPTLPNYFYNNLKQIVQTRDHVMILNEMVHDARIIRLNSQHVAPEIRKWMGDSIGRWEGDTLVVETTNFTNQTRFRGASENLKVTERITRIDDNTILYRFTVEDPSTWATSWTGEYTWEATDEQVYEYACHEHNYAMGNILRGARLLEKEAAEKNQPKARP
jgi:hypothetical protein